MKITKRQLKRIIKEVAQEERDRRFQQNREDQALAHPDHQEELTEAAQRMGIR